MGKDKIVLILTQLWKSFIAPNSKEVLKRYIRSPRSSAAMETIVQVDKTYLSGKVPTSEKSSQFCPQACYKCRHRRLKYGRSLP